MADAEASEAAELVKVWQRACVKGLRRSAGNTVGASFGSVGGCFGGAASAGALRAGQRRRGVSCVGCGDRAGMVSSLCGLCVWRRRCQRWLSLAAPGMVCSSVQPARAPVATLAGRRVHASQQELWRPTHVHEQTRRLAPGEGVSRDVAPRDVWAVDRTLCRGGAVHPRPLHLACCDLMLRAHGPAQARSDGSRVMYAR